MIDMTNNLPPNWTKLKFGDMVNYISDRVDNPGQTNIKYHIGLEHLDTDQIRIKRFGLAEEVQSSKFLCEKGDILFGRRRAYLRKLAISDKEAVVSTDAMIFRPKEKNVLSEFLPCFLQSYIFWERALALSEGSMSPRVKWKDLAKQEFWIPSLTEQKRISEVLWAVEDNIEKNEEVLKQIKHMKNVMLNRLVTNGINHTNYRKAEIGQIPENWKIMRLTELSLDGINNGVFNDPKKVGKGYRLINVVNMYSGSCIDTSILTLLDIDSETFKKRKVERGDIFFTRSSLVQEGIAFCNIYLSHDNDITYDGHLMRVRPNQKIIEPKYLRAYCSSRAARRYFISVSKTTTMTTLSQSDLGSLPVACPPLPEQREIVNILAHIDTQIDILANNVSTTRLLKKKLTNEFMSGKLRIPLEALKNVQ